MIYDAAPEIFKVFCYVKILTKKYTRSSENAEVFFLVDRDEQSAIRSAKTQSTQWRKLRCAIILILKHCGSCVAVLSV